FNCSVEPGQLNSSGSLCGDSSRQVAVENGARGDKAVTPEPAQAAPSGTDNATNTATTAVNETNPASETTSEPASGSSALSTAETAPTQVYGQAYLNRLLGTLLPHRQALNQPINEDLENDA
ncbi:MAG TPA: hypothetical protein V6D04_14045, partial [Candidatus Obscuribacterales bacterium]